MKSSLTSLLDAMRALRDALTPSSTPPTPPTPSDDHPYDDRIFSDPDGIAFPMNPGDITFPAKRPEQITSQDLVDALTLPDLFQGIPVIDKTWDEMLDDPDNYADYTRATNPKPFIWTARGAKLIYVTPDKYGVTSTAKHTLTGEELKWWQNSTLNPSNYAKTPTTETIAAYNARRLKDIENAHVAIDVPSGSAYPAPFAASPSDPLDPLNPSCQGLKLDRVYGALFTGSVATRTPSSYLQRCFQPRRPFLIDGEVDKKATGGLMTKYGLLATSKSLVIRKARIQRKDSQGYITIYVDCRQGVSQLQVIDSVFEQAGPDTDNINTRTGHGFAANYIYLYFEDKSPYTDDTLTTLTNDNLLEHVLLKGNTIYGTSFITSDMARFTKSYRAIANTFFIGQEEDNLENGRPYYIIRGETSSAMSHTNSNGATYANRMSYNSYPLFFADNKFYGSERAIPTRVTWSTSNDGVGLETAQAYFINNTFRNLISKHTIHDGGRYAESHAQCHATYETYMSVTKLWFVNNIVQNVMCFTHMNNDNRGLFKGKGTGIPYGFRPGWNFANVIRYYVGNKVTFEKQTIWNSWLDATGQSERYVNGKDADGNIVKRLYDPYDPFTTFGIKEGNNWKRSEWLIDDKYGEYPPLHIVIAKDCPKCGHRNPHDATQCESTTWTCKGTITVDGKTTKCGKVLAHDVDTCPKCGYVYTGSTTLKNIYPMDKYPWLIGEKHYDMIFQKGVDQNLDYLDNIDSDGIDHEFKDNITTHFNEIIQGIKKSSHYIPAPVYAYVFENNVIDLGDFCFGGMQDSSSINTVNFICRNNTFKARRMSSVYTEDNTKKVLWTSKRWMKDSITEADNDEYIFNIVPNDYYRATWSNYNGTPTQQQIAADDTLELHNSNTILVRRPIKALVDVSGNTFIVSDFVKNNTVIPTEIKFLLVKWSYSPDIYTDLGITINKIALPATVIIDNNDIHTPTDPENTQNALIHFHSRSINPWGSYVTLNPTTPSP